MSREVLQEALELLAVATFITPKLQAKRTEVINAGLQALERPAQQEPVAWRWSESNGQRWFDWTTDWSHYYKAKSMGVPIEYAYTSPQPAQRKPLTDDEIWREYRFLWPFHPAEERKLASDILMFARAIEARLKELNQ